MALFECIHINRATTTKHSAVANVLIIINVFDFFFFVLCPETGFIIFPSFVRLVYNGGKIVSITIYYVLLEVYKSLRNCRYYAMFSNKPTALHRVSQIRFIGYFLNENKNIYFDNYCSLKLLLFFFFVSVSEVLEHF